MLIDCIITKLSNYNTKNKNNSNANNDNNNNNNDNDKNGLINCLTMTINNTVSDKCIENRE